MTIIEITDTFRSAVAKMSEGNPGAISALVDIGQGIGKIDPGNMLGALGPILQLDSLGIRGSAIYVLYSDKCGRDARKTILLLRAVQLGLLPRGRLKELSEDQHRAVNLSEDEWSEIESGVLSRLPDFSKEPQ